MHSKKSIFVRTTPEEHDLADQLLQERSEESVSRMVVALIREDWERSLPRNIVLRFDYNGKQMAGKPVRIAGDSIVVKLIAEDTLSVQCVAPHQSNVDDFRRAWKYLHGNS